MANVRVVLHHAEIAHLTSWSGDVGRAVDRLGRETIWWQRIFAPKRTGRLAASLKLKRKRFARGIGFEAGSDVHYAIYQERGTHPHIIRAQPGHALKFGGRYAQVVHHPGNRATHFLERGLDQALKMWGRGI
jgi:hypothetical protein